MYYNVKRDDQMGQNKIYYIFLSDIFIIVFTSYYCNSITYIYIYTYINCYYFILGAVSRILSRDPNLILIIPEVDQPVLP